MRETLGALLSKSVVSTRSPAIRAPESEMPGSMKTISAGLALAARLAGAAVPAAIGLLVTHDAGNPRDQTLPFFEAIAPRGYIGWGKSTQLGYGLGITMGAKLAEPKKLCVNVMGDAAIGMTGMDFETAARERIPISGSIELLHPCNLKCVHCYCPEGEPGALDFEEIRRIVDHYLDQVVDRGECDLVADITGPFPMDVISALLGIPESEQERVRQANDDLKAVLDDAAESLVELLRQPEASEGIKAFKAKRPPPWVKEG